MSTMYHLCQQHTSPLKNNYYQQHVSIAYHVFKNLYERQCDRKLTSTIYTCLQLLCVMSLRLRPKYLSRKKSAFSAKSSGYRGGALILSVSMQQAQRLGSSGILWSLTPKVNCFNYTTPSYNINFCLPCNSGRSYRSWGRPEGEFDNLFLLII